MQLPFGKTEQRSEADFGVDQDQQYWVNLETKNQAETIFNVLIVSIQYDWQTL